jgi:hypothetical protein
VDCENRWPVRPRPRRDELLSSWLQELARGNGKKVQALSDYVFGKDHQIWNRDVDRLAPRWVLSELGRHTGVSSQSIEATTLNGYRGKLYRKRHISGQLRWILPLQMYHRKYLGFGLQYCSQCLLEDDEPYFRRRWRVAYCTFCFKHNSLLRDRCWQCGASVAFHRRELGRPMLLDVGSMSICHSCGQDLRVATPLPIPAYNQESYQKTIELLKSLESNHRKNPRFGLSFHAILHQQCRLILSERSAPRYREFIRQQIHCPDMRFLNGRFPFEMRSLIERHHVISMAMWVMSDWRERLAWAWKSKAVRYNVLLKDLDHPPRGYVSFAQHLNRNWTSRHKQW